jgi:hypothetical protein
MAEIILLCFHCGNLVPQDHLKTFTGQEMFERFEGRNFYEEFEYQIFACSTCKGVSIYGDFLRYPRKGSLPERRIYPQGSQLLPENHKIASSHCVPKSIVDCYQEVWPLRHISPNAFAGQIRRALEMICDDQKAEGDTLFTRLKHLSRRGTFPGHFGDVVDLMRQIGNIGAHNGQSEIDFWDAELMDDFFRALIEYVYILPSRILRLRQRLQI